MQYNIQLLNTNDKNKPSLNEIEEIIKKAYDFIKNLLNINIQFKILHFKIYFNQTNNKSSFGGKNIIFIYIKKHSILDILIFKKTFCKNSEISLLKHSLYTLISHELTHLFTFPIKFPFWFSEGLAQYISYKFVEKYLKNNIMNTSLNSSDIINELNSKKGIDILKKNKDILKTVKYALVLAFFYDIIDIAKEKKIYSFVLKSCDNIERTITTNEIFLYLEFFFPKNKIFDEIKRNIIKFKLE